MAEELLDTYDIHGNFLGVKTRSFCHGENPGCYHKPVWIWIKNDRGQVLLQKLANSKKEDPGRWGTSVAGHVLAGESSLHGCIREIKEELGIDIKENDLVFKGEWLNQEGWELGQIYLLKINAKASQMNTNRDETQKVKWFSYKHFVKLMKTDKFCKFTDDYSAYVQQILK